MTKIYKEILVPDTMVDNSSLSNLVLSNKGIKGSAFIEDAATILNETIRYSGDGLVIKKYDAISEPIWNEIFLKLQEVSKQETMFRQSPVAYINLDRDLMQKYLSEDNTDFYRVITGTVLNAAKQSSLENTDAFKKINGWYQNDFKMIYERDLSKLEVGEFPLLTHYYNFGSNVADLCNELRYEDNKIHPLVNFSAIPNYEEGAVTVDAEKFSSDKKAIMTNDGSNFEEMLQYSVAIMNEFLIGSDQSISRSLAIPGYAIDILRPSFENQEWNISCVAEESTFYMMEFMKTLNI